MKERKKKDRSCVKEKRARAKGLMFKRELARHVLSFAAREALLNIRKPLPWTLLFSFNWPPGGLCRD
jgi:hypothetical protein